MRKRKKKVTILDLQSWRRFFPYGNKTGFSLIKAALPFSMDTHTLLPVP